MAARNILRLFTEAFTNGDQVDLASGQKLQFLPEVDNQGSIEIGDGTTDMDLKIFLGSTAGYALFDVSANTVELNTALNTNGTVTMTGALSLTGTVTPSSSGFVAYKVPTALTANTTLNSTHFGALVQASTGALVLTLPAAAAGNSGAWIKIVNIIDQNLTVTGPANTMIAINDAAATSVVANTANTKLGSSATFISNGTKWIASTETGTWSVVA